MSMCAEIFSVPEDDAARILSDPEFFTEVASYGNDTMHRVSLEKSWHGVFYLLTGSAWDPKGPLGLIAVGGDEVPESDGGYGPARLLSSADTTTFNAALAQIDEAAFWDRFDADKMTTEGIYPGIWDEPADELQEEYTTYFIALKAIAERSASRDERLLVWLA